MKFFPNGICFFFIFKVNLLVFNILFNVYEQFILIFFILLYEYLFKTINNSYSKTEVNRNEIGVQKRAFS